ncbi:SusC/RagA family TonB-linked outer membrane protein [Sphingobacterium faecale]|uniref:TonB-dependent receptor n=1 Tax=Sphingobacterium faecale TaxID=2803775 RepID=A0ABS1R2U7_9SPHI|nr:TonB-dependent receptor [Sphingobacterium faecale]MBL1409032.1 TonB-dependent receptor [Sphingobacterium faecale]
MKKILQGGHSVPIRKCLKRLLMLKFIVILLLSSTFGAIANVSKAQGTVSLRYTDVSLKNVLIAIEQQTKVTFVYHDNSINDIRIRNLDISNKDWKAFLMPLLASENFDLESLGANRVLLKKKNGQDRIVSGTVKDEYGKPLVGVSIKEKGRDNATSTNSDGQYSFVVSTQDIVLQISYLGYLSQEISANTNSRLDVILKEDLAQLEEVVVVGYGTQRKKDLTGAVSNISADKLNTQSNVNIGQAIQGKIAGVDVVSQGGAPGAGSRITIRGIGTLNNVNPLYIVDGIYMNNMDNINPNDVESIDVLKDASSAAIYGSRAANGVIIVTTKSGTKTDGVPQIEASVNTGLQSPSRYMEMLNAEEWARITTLSRAAIGKTPLAMAEELSSKEDNDWQHIMMGSALMQNYNATIKGGSQNFTYYTSVGYMNQDGTIKGTEYKRYNAQFKTDYTRGWFKMGSNVLFSAQQNNPLYGFARGGYLGIILQSIPTLSQYDPSNSRGGYGKVFGDATDIPNPLGILDEKLTKRTWDENKIFLNFYAEVKLPLGLKYRFNVTPDFSYARNTIFENVYDFGLRNNSISSLSDDRTNGKNLLVENLLNYEANFGKSRVTAMVGYAYQNFQSRYIMASGRGLPQGIYEVGAATQDRLNNAYSNESALTSIISRAFYSYDDRYLLTATYRRDGSSKFNKDNRYGHFPSFSLGWNVMQESFMKKVHFLDQMKLRGGYGVLGNQEIADYMYSSVVTSNINYPDGNGGLLLGAFPKEFANPSIRWEETAMTNIGIDMTMLSNRLGVTADYYVKNTKDILLTVPIPISTGGANDPVVNAGRIQNKGVEFSLNWNERPSEHFSYGITATGNVLTNRVVAMGEKDQIIHGGTNRTNVATTRTLAGYPIGGFWLIPTAGIFQNDSEVSAHSSNGSLIQPNAKAGDIRFVDSNGDGKITDDDRVYMGSPLPSSSFGLNFNASYHSFDLLLGLQAVLGNKIYNGTRLELEGVNKGTNYLRTVLDYWTPENPNTTIPRLVWDDPNQNSRPQSDRYLEKGDFFRLRNVQVGYTLPASLFRERIKKLRLYTSIENPWTITGYSGFTPDIDGGGSVTSRGFDNFVYPINRIFMFGAHLSF